jgi:hypothetical protein
LKLRRLFWLVFLLCSIIPPFILSVFFITRSYYTEKNLVLRNLQATSSVFSTSLRNIIEANRTDMAVTSEGPFLQGVVASEGGLDVMDQGSREYLVKIFKARVRASKLVMGVSLMDRNGFILASSSEGLIGSKNPLPGNSFEKIKDTNSYYLTDTFYLPTLTKVPLYAMILPLYGKDGFRGALGFSFSADFIQEMVDRAELTKRFQSRLITVVDRNNRIISTSDPDFQRGESLSNYLEGTLPESRSDISADKKVPPKKQLLIRFKTQSGNNIGYFSRIDENGWGLLLSINEDEIL